ncbi:unnamed protein product [Polarella glacialis]|uniref:Uncharacterized protein n=1 Tax=Polarella glacialis TaxID=89957 RepID=A0A813F353_POLGL|nr:unnamed protein product [Polarella glacialis]CAE8657256.1 unnamed protein product [Polarella glacialis]
MLCVPKGLSGRQVGKTRPQTREDKTEEKRRDEKRKRKKKRKRKRRGRYQEEKRKISGREEEENRKHAKIVPYEAQSAAGMEYFIPYLSLQVCVCVSSMQDTSGMCMNKNEQSSR